MHARPEVREHLLATKMRKWALIGQHPAAYPNCSPAQARRNFSRLFSRYSQIVLTDKSGYNSPVQPAFVRALRKPSATLF